MNPSRNPRSFVLSKTLWENLSVAGKNHVEVRSLKTKRILGNTKDNVVVAVADGKDRSRRKKKYVGAVPDIVCQ
jgi:hypothetical protein